MFHPSEPPSVPLRRPPSAGASYHVGLDTMMGRRSRHRPEEVAIDGFLLLDTGEYELVTALIPLDVFWKMKALDILGQVRTANRARAARPSAYPDVGSVWLVDGDLELPTTASAGSEADTHARRADGGGGTRFRSRTRSWRASRRVKDRARTIRASGSSGCGFARSIRSIGWPSNRKVPASSRPCTCGTCFRSSRQIEPRRGATKSPARRRASLVSQEAVRAFPPTRRLRAALPLWSCRTSSE